MLGLIGALGFLIAAVATTVALAKRHGIRVVLPGGVVLVVASIPWLGSHIYWPEGTLTLVGLTLGLAVLALATSRRTTPADPVG